MSSVERRNTTAINQESMMRPLLMTYSRREFVRAMTWGAAALAAPGAFAEALTFTPRQTEGPFYPNRLPLDTDNDLIMINDALTQAVGEITHLGGRILDPDGRPVRNAEVEIWQVDGHGVYLHSQSAGAKRDANFQGFGRFLTGSSGEYYFRTVKPVPYPGRTPHIHFAINRGGKRVLTTQMYVKGEKRNERDGIYRSLRDEKQRDAITIEFKPLEESKLGELTATFDIVLGETPEQT
jgi:protocatechuate 3,4-dioxygenase beta subunit